jgi:phage-related protein
MEFMEYRDPIILYLDDKPSTDYGIKVYESNILSAPSKKLEFIEVDGRDGALTVDNGYEDFILKLSCVLVNEHDEIETTPALARRAKKFLLNGTTRKIQLSEDMDYYLLGTYNSDIDIEEAIENFGLFQAQFRCKPYRFSNKSKTVEITTKNTVIKNDEYKTKPVIDVYATGDITININNQEIILKALEGHIQLDCDKMNATTVNSLEKTVNANQKMYSDFPVLEEGNNNITWTLGDGDEASFTKIIIKYRLVVI